MNLVFVDTSAWYAAVIPSDPNHDRAKAWLAENRSELLVTDFIVDELLTLLRSRNENRRAIELGRNVFERGITRIEWVTQSDVHSAWRVFRDFLDKGWSFTDCVSNVVLARLEITQAFAFDEHFRQFGSISIVP